MLIEIDLNKSVEENAGIYFDLAKKSKKKLEGAKAALESSRKQLEKLQKQEESFYAEEEKKLQKVQRKREWYEKFHWFISSEEFLCIGGKDATSNEILIKKHVEPKDIVFHTEAPGSPFFVIKNGQEAGEKTIQECAQATAIYSKAWKLGHTQADVFWVKPEQVTKEAKAGEFIGKGAFMIYGKKNFLYSKMECGIGLVEGQIIGGPYDGIKSKTDQILMIIPGKDRKSELAKKIKTKLKGGELDDIVKFLPGEGEIRK